MIQTTQPPSRLLVCTDLDRTLLPNGPQDESPTARSLFKAVAGRPEVAVAYVTGRRKALVEEAIDTYGLPWPDWVICDVGTSIYSGNVNRDWTPWETWADRIAQDWGASAPGHPVGRPVGRQAVDAALSGLTGLTPQPEANQGRFKVSFFASAHDDGSALVTEVERRLADHGLRAAVIWSVDETTDQGLLDVLPSTATKLHGIEFLMAEKGYAPAEVVFSGDSGNDLPVLCSPIPATLVANATDAVRAEAVRRAAAAGQEKNLYLATGQNMPEQNGCYAAGIIEGLLHYHPGTAAWLP